MTRPKVAREPAGGARRMRGSGIDTPGFDVQLGIELTN